MLDKSCYELIPFVPILWRGDIRLVPKRVQDVLRRQLSWHETQFDKRPNSVGQQAVVDLVYVGEVIDRKSTRLNSSHSQISYAVFCLKKKKTKSSITSYNTHSTVWTLVIGNA